MRQGCRVVKIVRLDDYKAAQYFADLYKRSIGDNTAGFQHFAGHIKPLATGGHPTLGSNSTRPVLPFLRNGLKFFRRNVAGIAVWKPK